MFFTRLLESVIKTIYKLGGPVLLYLPGSSMNTIWRELDRQGKDVLDVGGGWGDSMRFLATKCEWQQKVNADIFLPHLIESKKKGTHNIYILSDARYLPFRGKSFDIVLCLEVIEHMPKEEGFKLLSELERIARKQIILTAPVGEKIQAHPEKIKTFPWGHFSQWSPADFRRLGYKVRGDGFPCIKGCLLVASTNKLLSLLGYLLYPIASPFVYFFPDRAGGMTCIKQISRDS